MADDDRLKILEDRLTRLEAVLTQRPPTGGGGGTPPGGGVVVDPAPWGGGRSLAVSASAVSNTGRRSRALVGGGLGTA